MVVSSCCGAPIRKEFRSDLPNWTDDDYDLQIPVWVCSQCGAIVRDNGLPKGGLTDATSEGSGSQSES